MRAYLSTVKFFVFALNVICLILGITTILFAVVGLQSSELGSDEYAYFMVGVIIGTLVCLTTIFGFYGAVCELMAVNIVYILLFSILLTVQYLELRNFQPHTFFNKALQHAEDAWQQLETQPQLMAAIETQHRFCALQNASDYGALHVDVPVRCFKERSSEQGGDALLLNGCRDALELSYQQALKREKLYSWTTMIAESFAMLCAAIFVSLLYVERREDDSGMRVSDILTTRSNHASSRSFLMAR